MRNIIKNNILLNAVHHSGVSYPVPVNLTYWWNFGILALVCLVIQILTGIFLAMHYVPNADLAFASVDHIMRDINYGWLIRYLHANGASMFFLVVYVHIFRGLYYGSYTNPRQLVWCTGVVILLLMILTAFMGYVLPWGQMSFWAATVITNLVSAVPYVGEIILNWLWGGYSVDNATLNRFFSFHYLFPFILTGLIGIHIVYLHEHGSNNSLGIIFKSDKIPFTPYFTVKDIYFIMLFFIIFSYFVFFDPVYLGHPDNFIPANPLVTPAHIVPEWYFLPFYAILRSVPNKLFGVILLLASILILLAFPFYVKSKINSGYFRPMYQKFFWLFFFNCLLLGWIGGKPIEPPYYLLGQIFTIFYFAYFIIILPLLAYCENMLYSRYANNEDNEEYDDLEEKSNIDFVNIQKYDKNIAVEYNIKLILYVAFLLIVLGSGMYMYLEGERVPNLSILICGFIAYISLSNTFINMINDTVNISFKLWIRLIKSKKSYFNTLQLKLNNILYIVLWLVYNLTKVNNNFYSNFLTNNCFIWLYNQYKNPWWEKFLNKLNITLMVELLVFKYFELFLSWSRFNTNLIISNVKNYNLNELNIYKILIKNKLVNFIKYIYN